VSGCLVIRILASCGSTNLACSLDMNGNAFGSANRVINIPSNSLGALLLSPKILPAMEVAPCTNNFRLFC